MYTSSTTLTTQEAPRLIKRLCTHWTHKFTVETGISLGRIDFGESQCLLTGDDESIHIELHCPDEATTSRMQEVVFDHLQRVGKSGLPQPVWSTRHVE